MSTNNADKSSSWKNWIIKKLLSNDSTKEDILNFIANDEDNKNIDDLNDNNEKNLIKNIVNLNEKSVEDLMIPRSEIVALDHDKSYNEILEVIKEEGHSRIPVFKKNIDNVIGFFHIKDFPYNLENRNGSMPVIFLIKTRFILLISGITIKYSVERKIPLTFYE